MPVFITHPDAFAHFLDVECEGMSEQERSNFKLHHESEGNTFTGFYTPLKKYPRYSGIWDLKRA
jgi:hypothetical protein